MKEYEKPIVELIKFQALEAIAADLPNLSIEDGEEDW